jgi:hypothetical protein
MLKTDLFVGVQQILVADITYYLLITAYPLHRRPQLPVTGGASDHLGAGSFRRHHFMQGFFAIHISPPLQAILAANFLLLYLQLSCHGPSIPQ